MSAIASIDTHLSKDCLDFISTTLNEKKPVNDILQAQLSSLFNTPAVLVNSPTAALHLALCALDLKRGDKVLCSVNNFPLAAGAIRYFDAEPIFIDCNLTDYNINIDALKKALEQHNHKKLKALFLNHHSGNLADVKAIKELCASFNVQVIHDASFGLGMSLDKKLLGSDELMSCYSFAPISKFHAFNAGFVLINDTNLYNRALKLSDHALERNAYSSDGDLEYFYDVSDIGHDYMLSELAAAAALYVLQNYQNKLNRRKQIAQIYNQRLKGLRHISLPVHNENSAYCNYVIRVDKNRDSFARKLKAFKIHTAMHYIPINFLSYYKQKYNLKVTDFPNALSVYAQILSLPMYASLSDEQVEYVCDKICELDAQWI